jgi:hypothetical protein
MKALLQKSVIGSLFLLACAGMSIRSQAATYTMVATDVFETAGSPITTGGTLTATFQDVSGGVLLTLTVTGLQESYYNVNTWWFNVAAAYANTLTVTLVSTTEGSGGAFTIPSVNQRTTPTSESGNNGYFNLWLNGWENFGNGDSITLLITSSDPGLSASDFVRLDSPTRGSYAPGGAFYTAAQINAGQDAEYIWVGAPCATPSESSIQGPG